MNSITAYNLLARLARRFGYSPKSSMPAEKPTDAESEPLPPNGDQPHAAAVAPEASPAGEASLPHGEPPLPAEKARPSDFINVNDVISKLSINDHVRNSEEYFLRYRDEAAILRKPFLDIPETQELLYGMSAILQGLNLFPGARVLDFGAGTGWISKILALLQCEPIALDVSPTALGLARQVFAGDALTRDLPVSFLPYDGRSIPLPDGHVDRIVCFDSFHHVPNQTDTLREFFRVLKAGGIAAFREPGPEHSKGRQSQYEMRHYQVIENDIEVEKIWDIASKIGFSDMRMALAQPKSPLLPIPTYNEIITKSASQETTDMIFRNYADQASNLRIFFLYNGREALDSRHVHGLMGTFQINVARRADGKIRGSASVQNVGSAVWLPSAAKVGGVSLGVRVANRQAGVPIANYARIPLSAEPILPGQAVHVDWELPLPEAQECELYFDLVSEFVIWFELLGTTPVVLRLPDIL